MRRTGEEDAQGQGHDPGPAPARGHDQGDAGPGQGAGTGQGKTLANYHKGQEFFVTQILHPSGQQK